MTRNMIWIKTNKILLLALLMFLAGISLLAFPSFASWQTAHHQSRLVEAYKRSVNAIDAETCGQMIAAADQFNQDLAVCDQRWGMLNRWEPTLGMLSSYTSLLSIDDTGILGYVTIPKIQLELPIFHGTDEKALDIAVCHVVGSSLPSGQPNTHTVITGHRSRPSSKLFRDLGELAVGDVFSVTVLNQGYVYVVDQVQVVLPTDLSKLNIEEGQNYCTLVTCTPYGSESQRLLVRGRLEENKI